MDRRKFLYNSLGIITGSLLSAEVAKGFKGLAENKFFTLPQAITARKLSKYTHKLPLTDQNFKRSRN